MPTTFRFLKLIAILAVLAGAAVLALAYLVQPARREFREPVDSGVLDQVTTPAAGASVSTPPVEVAPGRPADVPDSPGGEPKP